MENQRVRISKAMLKSGLLKLLKEKQLNQITVDELCRTSEINRTTFYKYYGSVDDLLTDAENDFLTQLDEELKNVITQSPNALIQTLRHLYDQRELFCLLSRSVPLQKFSEHLFSMPSIGVIFKNMLNESKYSETEAKYVRQFVLQGTFSVLREWLNSEKPEPVETIAEVLEQLRSKL